MNLQTNSMQQDEWIWSGEVDTIVEMRPRESKT